MTSASRTTVASATGCRSLLGIVPVSPLIQCRLIATSAGWPISRVCPSGAAETTLWAPIDPAGAGAVLHHHGLPERSRELVRDQPRDDVAGAAGRIGDDEMHGAARNVCATAVCATATQPAVSIAATKSVDCACMSPLAVQILAGRIFCGTPASPFPENALWPDS